MTATLRIARDAGSGELVLYGASGDVGINLEWVFLPCAIGISTARSTRWRIPTDLMEMWSHSGSAVASVRVFSARFIERYLRWPAGGGDVENQLDPLP